MAEHSYHEHRKAVPLFNGVGVKELDEIAQASTELDDQAGRVLMSAGRFAHEMFVVVPVS